MYACLLLSLILQCLVEKNVSQIFLIDLTIGMMEIFHSEARLGSRVRNEKVPQGNISQTGIEHNLWGFVFVIILFIVT